MNGVYDEEQRRLRRYWADRDVGPVTTALENVLGSDVDAVYISSRNDQHATQAIAAARAGKHILVEKPMALTAEDARAMIAAADRYGVVLAVNHHLTGSPLHAMARRLVGEGRIGSLLSARINHAVMLPEQLRGWRLGRAPGSGVIMDILVHDASVLNPLCGEPRRVTARAVRQGSWNRVGNVDAVMSIIEFGPDANPVLAQTFDAFTVPHPGTSMEIFGDTGAIVIFDAMTQDTTGTVEVHDAGGIELIEVDTADDLYQIILRGFLAAVNGTGNPTATGLDGLLALQVALAATRSADSGRTELVAAD